ncbi:hypothetical protein ACA910_018403 [Epithemia clementina (nom. ined.)]
MNRFARQAFNVMCLLIGLTLAAAAESGLRVDKISTGAADNYGTKNNRNRILTAHDDTTQYTERDGACRLYSNNTGSGVENTHYTRPDNGASKTYQECKSYCDSNSACVAFESAACSTCSSSSTGRCELWTTLPRGYASGTNLYCYVKNGSSTTPPNYNNCHEINRRPIYGTGDLPKTITRDDGKILLAKHYQPFYVPVYGSDYVRKWRLYAIYSDQKKTSSSPSAYANLQIEFDFLGSGNDLVLTLPTTGVDDYDYRAEGHSDWYETSPNSYNADVYVKFHTNDGSNLHGKVWYIELLAYDCYAD